MEELNPELIKSQKKAVKVINIINISVLAIMLLLCLIDGGGFLSFALSLIISGGNLISMIIFIVNKNNYAFISNIIWMLALPIIGFGCCAAALNGAYH